MKIGDMPAYPPANEWIEEVREQLSGLTIRERVALAVMQGILSGADESAAYENELVTLSFDIAEAWLEEAEKRREKDV